MIWDGQEDSKIGISHIEQFNNFTDEDRFRNINMDDVAATLDLRFK
jgi:hypothetical protein